MLVALQANESILQSDGFIRPKAPLQLRRPDHTAEQAACEGVEGGGIPPSVHKAQGNLGSRDEVFGRPVQARCLE